MIFPVIDAHQDIALNILYATKKDFSRRHTLHEGTPIPGLAAHNNTDLPRLISGNVKLVFATIFSLNHSSITQLAKNRPENYNFEKIYGLKSGLPGALEQLALYHELFDKHPQIKHITSLSDYRSLKDRQVGLLIHLEGVDFFKSDLGRLDDFYNLGVRSLALTWRNQNAFASGNNALGGLTHLGKRLIHAVESKHIIFDLAHANTVTFWDAMDIINFPVIVSHTLCQAICQNSRNLDDRQIKAVAGTGGVICLAAIPDYIGGDSIRDYVKHFVHVADLVGVNHVAFGTDFEGLVDPEDRFIKNFEDVSMFPNVLNQLKKSGFSDTDIAKISHQNLERIITQRLSVS